MATLQYIFYQCQNAECRLRFPAQMGLLSVERCPRCESLLERVTSLLIDQESNGHSSNPNGLVIEALLDNIRSAWNVGSIFRTADGTGIQHLFLCGITPTPTHPQVVRTSLGAENSIRWQYESNALTFVKSLISTGYRVWVLEETVMADNLYNMEIMPDKLPILLVVGNEICGVDPDILAIAERVISIPMMGLKRSYNVAVAFGIAASYLRYCQSFSQGSDKILPNT